MIEEYETVLRYWGWDIYLILFIFNYGLIGFGAHLRGLSTYFFNRCFLFVGKPVLMTYYYEHNLVRGTSLHPTEGSVLEIERLVEE